MAVNPLSGCSPQSYDATQIERVDTDTLLSKVAHNLIAEIVECKSRQKVQDFFSTIHKMSQVHKNDALLSGYLAFREINDLQWLALKIAKDSTTHADRYLLQLVEACTRTKNKEIALEAANSISRPSDKAKYLAMINRHNF